MGFGLCQALARIASFGQAKTITVRRQMRNPLADQLKLMTYRGPTPTDRTRQFLRRFDLASLYDKYPERCLVALLNLSRQEQSLESMYALAEVAYVEGEKARIRGNEDHSSKMFATALIASYRYLFDGDLPDYRNAYDPEFRRACDIYNESLEGILRIIDRADNLRAGSTHTIDLYGTPIEFAVENDGRWDPDDLSHFEFVSDFRTKGLKNQYNTYGLGVPLIAVRDSTTPTRPWEQFYPPGLAFPVTAFLEIAPNQWTAQHKAGNSVCSICTIRCGRRKSRSTTESHPWKATSRLRWLIS